MPVRFLKRHNVTVAVIQESKLSPNSETPSIQNFTTVRKDRRQGQGGGLLTLIRDPGMSLNCALTRVCRKSASRPGYVVKVRTDPGYVVKQCPRIVMNKIFDWH